MISLSYLLILINYNICQCLPLTNRLAPDGLKGAIKNVRLTDVSSSDAGCRKYYRNWFLMIYPYITDEEALPVRSTNAVAAGILAYMGCAFDCMDLRSHAEMTRTSTLRRADEHRIRGSLRMHCPVGEYIHFYGEYNSIDADYGSYPPQISSSCRQVSLHGRHSRGRRWFCHRE